MSEACSACGGIGYGSRGPNGFEDTGTPCRVCLPDGVPKPPGSFVPRVELKNTAEIIEEDIDGNLRSRSVPWEDGEVTAHHPHPDNMGR